MRNVARYPANSSVLGAAVLVAALSFPASASELDADIDRLAADVEEQVIVWRRDIHENPELSNREVRTAELVAKHLESLGMEVERGVAHTGVVGILRGGRPGRVVALRADMDALPVVERTGLPFASTTRGEYLGQEVGVMHACGHDNHVAILMGAATVLAGLREQLPGTVKFVFQPAEEGAPPGEDGGAGMMVREGVLEDPAVEAIFGLHVMQSAQVGEVAYRARGAMASADRFEIRVQGRQTHGAMPWAGVDPIVVGAQIVTALQTIVSRRVDITAAPAVVTVGTFNAGVRNNIVPDDAVLTGTLRTFDPAVTELVREQVRTIATRTAESMGASAAVEIDDGTPVTYNDPDLTERMLPTLRRVYGADKVAEGPLVTGAEDFAFYQEEIPGFFFWVGVRPPGVPPEEAVPNHSPYFDADEGALEDGVRVMSALAVDFLTSP